MKDLEVQCSFCMDFSVIFRNVTFLCIRIVSVLTKV